LVLWLLKDPKIRKRNFNFPRVGPFKVKNIFNNNNVQLITFGDDDVAIVNVNKLKPYQSNGKIVISIGATILHCDKKALPRKGSSNIPRNMVYSLRRYRCQ